MVTVRPVPAQLPFRHIPQTQFEDIPNGISASQGTGMLSEISLGVNLTEECAVWRQRGMGRGYLAKAGGSSRGRRVWQVCKFVAGVRSQILIFVRDYAVLRIHPCGMLQLRMQEIRIISVIVIPKEQIMR